MNTQNFGRGSLGEFIDNTIVRCLYEFEETGGYGRDKLPVTQAFSRTSFVAQTVSRKMEPTMADRIDAYIRRHSGARLQTGLEVSARYQIARSGESERDSRDTRGARVSDRSETHVPNTRKTPLSDKSETDLLDTRGARVSDRIETHVLNTLETRVFDSREAEFRETRETDIRDTRGARVSERIDTHVPNTLGTRVSDGREAEFRDTRETQVSDRGYADWRETDARRNEIDWRQADSRREESNWRQTDSRMNKSCWRETDLRRHRVGLSGAGFADSRETGGGGGGGRLETDLSNGQFATESGQTDSSRLQTDMSVRGLMSTGGRNSHDIRGNVRVNRECGEMWGKSDKTSNHPGTQVYPAVLAGDIAGENCRIDLGNTRIAVANSRTNLGNRGTYNGQDIQTGVSEFARDTRTNSDIDATREEGDQHRGASFRERDPEPQRVKGKYTDAIGCRETYSDTHIKRGRYADEDVARDKAVHTPGATETDGGTDFRIEGTHRTALGLTNLDAVQRRNAESAALASQYGSSYATGVSESKKTDDTVDKTSDYIHPKHAAIKAFLLRTKHGGVPEAKDGSALPTTHRDRISHGDNSFSDISRPVTSRVPAGEVRDERDGEQEHHAGLSAPRERSSYSRDHEQNLATKLSPPTEVQYVNRDRSVKALDLRVRDPSV